MTTLAAPVAFDALAVLADAPRIATCAVPALALALAWLALSRRLIRLP